MEARLAGINGFVGLKQLPSKKAAVKTLWEFSGNSKIQGAKLTSGRNSINSHDEKCAPQYPMAPPAREASPEIIPARLCRVETNHKGQSNRVKLATTQDSQVANVRVSAELPPVRKERNESVHLEGGDRIPQKWMKMCRSLSRQESEGHRIAKLWLRLAVGGAGKCQVAQKQHAERVAAGKAARKLAEDKVLARQGLKHGGVAFQPPLFFLSTPWDEWVPHEMFYSYRLKCYCLTVQQGSRGPECFKILKNGQEQSQHLLQAHESQVIEPVDEEDTLGSFYEVRLNVDDKGETLGVDSLKLGKYAVPPARRYWIVGTWDRWVPHEMNWNPERHCFSFEVCMGSSAKESFQICVNGNRHLTWYPDARDASFHSGRLIYGPDGSAHGRSWTIGKHWCDSAVEGMWFEVRLRLKPDGKPRDVDWVRLAEHHEGGPVAREVPESNEGSLRVYCLRVAKSHKELMGATTKVAPAESNSGRDEAGHGVSFTVVSEEPGQDFHIQNLDKSRRRKSSYHQDYDGEELALCQQCGLPIGDLGYASPQSTGALMHGECLAQLMIEDMRMQDELRMQQDAMLKASRRAAYEIGWKPERVPHDARSQPPGMCCLVFEDGSNTVRVAPTMEPAASVNLTYLSVALLVRLREGREPLFSLDPIKSPKYIPYSEPKMQVKRFVPDWLAGTSVGEVMFQADYHLKELSMGEYEQPVVGMPSCHDFSENTPTGEWKAREWFIIRKAEIQVSDDNVLVPVLSMGIEARSLVAGAFGLEDAKITQPDHPLVKYAELFTKNFDLIAERKSVIFHLRELAKAAVLAKYLIDAKVHLDDSWFSLPDTELKPCVGQIPQLWNERSYSQIRVTDGQIDIAEEGIDSKMRGVYGGVEFGLDRFGLGLVPALPTAPRAEAVLVSRTAAVPSAFSMIGAGLPSGRAAMTPTVKAALAPSARAQGVDLDLAKIDLSYATRFPGILIGDTQSVGVLTTPGDAFWPAICIDSNSPLVEESKKLFRAIFNPAISDRREEGYHFIPPRTCPSYLSTLQALVKEEDTLRDRRVAQFLTESFTTEKVGNLFPRSWRSSIEIAGRSQRSVRYGLQPHPEYTGRKIVPKQVLESTSLAFDRKTEDGFRFRIYRSGNLEVRTTQECDGQEIVGGVFSLSGSPRLPIGESGGHGTDLQEGITKVTLYVEQGLSGTNSPLLPLRSKPCARSSAFHYYVVLETDHGGAVLTESVPNGQVTFECNPEDLEDRISLSKAVYSSKCHTPEITVGDIKSQREKYGTSFGTSSSGSKQYARAVFNLAGGRLKKSRAVTKGKAGISLVSV